MGVDRSVAALVLCLAVLAIARGTKAQRVAIVRPLDDDSVLVDAFNRLNAELRIHEFEPLVLEPATRTRDPDELALAAQHADAFASIAFVRHDGKTSVEVWLADRVSGKVTMRTLALDHTNDASSVLAIRAVELLRASLREFDLAQRPPPDVVGVDIRPVPAAVESLAASAEPSWTLRVEGAFVLDRPRLGAAVGPSVGISYRLSERVDIGLAFAAPLLFGAWRTSQGSASVRQQLGWAEVRLHPLRSRKWKLGLNAAVGEHYLNAQGQANAPLVSRSDSVWSWLFALGAHAQLNVAESTAFIVSVRTLLLAPRPAVGIGQRTAAIAQPTIYASAGVVLGF